MNNFELAVKIEECLIQSNPLDSIVQLVELRRNYKETDFYKNTKLSFEQCIEMYGKVLQIQAGRKDLSELIVDYIENLDTEKLQRAFDKLAARLEKVDLSQFDSLLDGLKNNLNFSELRSKIQEFEELNQRASKL